ncbi:MAG TPA: lysophospholipid acyltransferase family protein [Spirochaetia bacterium]|nr:lysophospholipid acyltransferase family protein [Spirochaetia bacterium]
MHPAVSEDPLRSRTEGGGEGWATAPRSRPARHVAWASLLFRSYLRSLLKRSFHGLRLLGEAPEPPADLPIVLIGNHNTWWDGFLPYYVNTVILHRTFYILMLEEQLARYPFFRLLGAFGIRPGHPRSAMQTLRYCSSLLDRPDTLLCLFPQGVLVPFRARPLGFQRGLETILSIHGGPVTLLQFAMRCEFGGNRLPEAYLLFNPARVIDPRDFGGMEKLERDQELLMDRLETEIARATPGRLLLGPIPKE